MNRLVLSVLSCAFLYVPGQAAEPAPGPLIVAHRGLLRHAPENTLANFRACLELNLGFEIDVRRSKDGQLVCIHDETLDRTTSGKGKVADFTLAELKKLDAGSWFDPAFKAERIPTLDEILALLAKHPQVKAPIAVDLKEAGTEAEIIRQAMKHRVDHRLLFIGRAIRIPDVRRQLRNAHKAAHVACLAESAQGITGAIADTSCDWVYLRHLPTKEDVQRIHQAGKKLFIAGPKVAGLEPENWKKAADLGFDAILTDHPLALARLLRIPGQKP